jgi:hypothetical protein
MLREDPWHKAIYVDPQTFYAVLRYESYTRDGRAETLWWKDVDTGRLYPMFVSSVCEILKSYVLDGKVNGTWTMIKRGTNYGIKAVKLW